MVRVALKCLAASGAPSRYMYRGCLEVPSTRALSGQQAEAAKPQLFCVAGDLHFSRVRSFVRAKPVTSLACRCSCPAPVYGSELRVSGKQGCIYTYLQCKYNTGVFTTTPDQITVGLSQDARNRRNG